MVKELIQSISAAIPNKGSNAGKVMTVVNGKYWMKDEPKPGQTHIVLEDVKYPDDHAKYAGKTFTNAVGYSSDTVMTINDKISLLTSHDAGYAVGIATLLRN